MFINSHNRDVTSIGGMVPGFRLKVISCLLPVIFLAAGGAFAEPLMLDWEKTWQLALEHSDAVAGAKDEVAKARHQIGEAWAGALPTVEFTSNFHHYFKVPESIFYFPGEDGQRMRIKTQFGSENNVSMSLDVNQPVWLAGKVGLALSAARKYRTLSRLGVYVSRADLRLDLTRSFYGALVADEFLQVNREALAQAERLENQTRALYDQGMVSEYDLIRAGVAVANLKPQVIDTETQRDLAYKGLKNTMGIDVDREIVLDGDLDREISPPRPYTDALDNALHKRWEFNQLELQSELYEKQFLIEKRSWLWPNFFFNLNWQSRADADNDLALNKYEFLDGWGGAIALSVPLFDGFAAHHRAQQARVNLRGVERQKQALKRGVQIQVDRALKDIKRAEAELKAANQTLVQAEKGMKIAEVRYEEGVGTQLEVLDAQLQFNQSRANLLNAKYGLIVAEAEYRRAIGAEFGEK